MENYTYYLKNILIIIVFVLIAYLLIKKYYNENYSTGTKYCDCNNKEENDCKDCYNCGYCKNKKKCMDDMLDPVGTKMCDNSEYVY